MKARRLMLLSLCALLLAAGPSADALQARPSKESAAPNPPRASGSSSSSRSSNQSSSQSSDDSDAPVSQTTTVVLDPGHGGFDRGGIPGQRVAEKTMNLDVALRVRSLLQASGYRVVMTRSGDYFVTLGNRVAIANSYRNGIFVCIHFNSATRRGANGIETYFYSSQSLPLASAIHYNVAGSAPSENRGVRRRGYYVLRNTRIPAILVECGFLTNPTEAQYAQSSAYQDRLANAIVRGIKSRGSTGSAHFLDQTHTYDPDISRHKKSSKSSKSSKSKSSKSKSASSSKKKKSSSSDDSDSSSKSSSSKKKSSSKKTED